MEATEPLMSLNDALTHVSRYTFLNDSRKFNINKLYEMLKDKDILFADYSVEHDGYDEDGPTSNLYHFYFVVKDNNKNVCYTFYVEDWYSSRPARLTFKRKMVLDRGIITVRRHQYNEFKKKLNEYVAKYGNCNVYDFSRTYYGSQDPGTIWCESDEDMFNKVNQYVI
jgi:hypothetical protein